MYNIRYSLFLSVTVRLLLQLITAGEFAITNKDLNQLPPVKETISQAFIDPDVTYKYKLTKVERQADGNPLMFLYDAILSDLSVDKDKFPHEDIVRTIPRPDQGGAEDPREPFVEIGHRFHNAVMPFGRAVMKEYMSEDFQFDKNHCKVLCWTNARVAWWNQSIRKTLIMDLSAKPTTTEEVKLHCSVLMPFEILMAQTNSGDLTNSSDYQVISMQFTEKTIWYGEKKDKSKKVSGYRVALMDIDENTILNTFILDPDEGNIKDFTIIFNDYLFLAKTKRAWTAYYAFKAEVMLIRDIKDIRGQMVCKKDLEYAYAISVHKAQGSTYNQVFIDMADINNNRNWIERNKLKYVAFSRPRYLATILTGS